MTNKEVITNELNKLGFELGCYDSQLDKASKKTIKDLLWYLKEDATDVDVKIGRKLYVVEINTVDGEKDLNVLSKEEYIECYGSSRWED